MTSWNVHRLPMADPGDVSTVDNAIAEGTIDPARVIGIISQTEGTGYARALTTLTLSILLGQYLRETPEEVVTRIPMMMIGLCGGLMSPHHTIITRHEPDGPVSSGDRRLAVGVGSTRDLSPSELGTARQATLMAEAVAAAIDDGGLEPDAVTCVQVKCPAMTPARAATLEVLPGGSLAAASSRSKAASALGVGMALGEIDPSAVTDEIVNRDRTLFTRRGSVSAGSEQTACRVLAFGNSARSTSQLRSGCGVMADQLDVSGVLDALAAAGIEQPQIPLPARDAARVRQVFVNCGADLTTEVRGRRHTLNSDYLAGDAGVIAKAVANAVVASVVGDSMVLASAGAEHQGPPGANLVAVIAEVEHD